MKTTVRTLAFSVVAAVALATASQAATPNLDSGHAVFVMTNDAEHNEVIAYERNPDGTLGSSHRYRTDGRGSGGRTDPLSAQGSLHLSDNKQWLFAANAGSGTVSVFRVEDSQLVLTDQQPSGGAEPVSIAQHGNLVYVLNAAGSSSVVGFFFTNGHLLPISSSVRFLSSNLASPGSVVFSPDGKFLLTTEEAHNQIDVFAVEPNGTLGPITVNPSAGPGAFAVNVGPNGTALVSETGSGGATAAISSYNIQANGTLTTINASVPTLGAANCWNVITPDGRFIYVSNAGSSTISGFRIGSSGTLTALPGTVVGMNPPGSGNLDIAISADGKFLYSLNSAGGSIGQFGIQADGFLTSLGTTGGLPAGSSLNGIAAN